MWTVFQSSSWKLSKVSAISLQKPVHCELKFRDRSHFTFGSKSLTIPRCLQTKGKTDWFWQNETFTVDTISFWHLISIKQMPSLMPAFELLKVILRKASKTDYFFLHFTAIISNGCSPPVFPVFELCMWIGSIHQFSRYRDWLLRKLLIWRSKFSCIKLQNKSIFN